MKPAGVSARMLPWELLAFVAVILLLPGAQMNLDQRKFSVLYKVSKNDGESGHILVHDYNR